MRAPLLLVLLVAVPAIAHAGGGQARGKRKPRPAPIDVAGAVASGQADRLCAAALDLVAAGQHPRASFLIAHCAEVPARAEAARAARIAIARRATAEAWSQVEIGFRGDAVGAPASGSTRCGSSATRPSSPRWPDEVAGPRRPHHRPLPPRASQGRATVPR
jgi:hypothetical protein